MKGELNWGHILDVVTTANDHRGGLDSDLMFARRQFLLMKLSWLMKTQIMILPTMNIVQPGYCLEGSSVFNPDHIA